MAAYLNSKKITIDQVGKKSGKFLLFIRCGVNLPLCIYDYYKNDDIIVVLSRYQEHNFPIDKDFWVLSGGLSKFDSARLFFLEVKEMLRFEAYAFFDPDVSVPFKDVSTLFKNGCENRKEIFQAAVASGSHTFWKFLYQKDSAGWREVSFVEVMAPFFSHKALVSVLHGFSDSISTWGLEYQWYSKCQNMSTAVYDPIAMRHDTPVDTVGGPFYTYLASMSVDPKLELKKLRDESVNRFYIECEIPGWIPIRMKKYFISIVGAKALARRRIAYNPLWIAFQRCVLPLRK